jgi:putative DNA primase/helicase
MDAALLLGGAQGIGKSTGVAALFGDEWTHDSQVNLEDKDGAAIMGRAWCVELAELSSMRRAKDVDSVKHFLSLREDTYRAPYERIATTTPRRAVVCGTTNDDAPLSDSTGNRRFWPLTVRRKIDVPWLAANRDAVWAEAVAALDSGEAWYLDDIAAATQALEAENYTHQDELVEALRTWAETVGEEGTTIRQAAGAIDVEDKDLDWHLQRRIASALRVLGLERGFVRADGEKHRRWVYPIGG